MAEPVALQIKPAPSMTLGDMLNMARGVQAYQQAGQINPLELQLKQQQARTGQIALDVEEQKNRERTAMQQFFSNPENFQTEGRVDIDKINAAVPKIAPLTGADYIDKFTKLGTSQTDSLKATQALNLSLRQMIASRMSVLGRAGVQDKNAYIKEMELLQKENPDNKELARAIQAYKNVWENFASGKEIPGIAIRGAQQLLTPSEQETALAPKAGTLSTGAQILPTVTTPSVAGAQPSITVGKSLADVQLPPGTEVVNPETGERKYLGPASQRNQTDLTAGLGVAQQAAQTGIGETVKSDWAQTTQDAAQAPSRIAIFQNIKKLTPDAFTGPTAERRQMIASFAQMLGMDVYKLETSSTDELMKNTKLLQLAGGNTDAARSLAEFANPNNKMTKEGINRVTDQLIGLERMKIAKANFVQPFSGNAQQYQQKLQQWNQISDPRLFQEMTRDEVKALRKSLSKKEEEELDRKVRLARQLGVIQ